MAKGIREKDQARVICRHESLLHDLKRNMPEKMLIRRI